MQAVLRKSGRQTKRPEAQARATLCKLTVLIPRSYNPDSRGARRPIELSKFVATVREIRQLASGYSVCPIEGWYRHPATGKGVRDRHFRFDTDLLVGPSVVQKLRNWKMTLERRFNQDSIYMSLTKRIIWL